MIKRIRIVNFKSLADVTVELEPVTVLVGRSGTGKSNFLDAIRFLRDYLVTPGDQTALIYGGWSRLGCATAPAPTISEPVRISFEVTFDIPGIAGSFEYRLEFSAFQTPNQFRFFSESLLHDSSLLFSQELGKWICEPKVLPVPPPGSPAIARINGVRNISLAYLMLTTGIGCYDFSSRVLQGPVAGIPMQQFGPKQDSARGLLDHAENYLQAFGAISDNLQNLVARSEIIAAVQILNSSVSSLELEVPTRKSIAVGQLMADRILTLDLAQQSEGFRRFLAHLIAMYQSPPKQVLAFEEPEKGIFPGAAAALADQFKACAAAGRGQVIMTTHSPELLDHFAPEQIRVVGIESFETKIGRVASEQVEAIKENLLSPGELLLVDPARRDTEETTVS